MKKPSDNITVSWAIGNPPSYQYDFGLFKAHKGNRITVNKKYWLDYVETRLKFEEMQSVLVDLIMPKKLTKLTKEQLDSLPKIAQDWIELITTGETDEESAKKAIYRIYEHGGMKPPKYIFFFDDPIQCLWGRIYAAIHISLAEGQLTLKDLQKRLKVSKKKICNTVDAAVRDTVRDTVDAAVDATVRAAVDATVDAAVRDTVDAAVDAAVDDTVRNTVDAAVDDTVRNTVDATVRDTVRNTVDAAVDAAVGAAVDAAVDATVRAAVDATVDAAVDAAVDATVRATVDATVRATVDAAVDATVRATVDAAVDATVGDRLWRWPSFSIWWSAWRIWRETIFKFLGQEFPGDGWMQLDRSHASWTWCYKKLAIICRMPRLWRDERGNLHREDGPALLYPSGRCWYFYHGVRVDEKIIMKPETITKDDILNEGNEEVKRVMIERISSERFAKMMDFKIISEDNFGALLQTTIGNTVYACAHVICPSTGREYYLRVPPSLNDAILAINNGAKPAGWEEWNEESEKAIWPESGKMETAHQAVAWLGGFRAEDYMPTIET